MLYRYLGAVLLFLLLPLAATRAQGLPGYVLTLTGDTLRGTLVETPQHKQVRLRTSDGRVQQFEPGQIRGYGLRGQALIASALVRRADGSTSRGFVLPQLLGPASLYAFADETGLLLQPPAPAADTLYELTAYNWPLLLNRHLPGCPALGLSETRVLSLPFEQRHITQLLTDYNRCLVPGWQPSPKVRGSAYRKSVDLEAYFSYIRHSNLRFDQPGTGTRQGLLLARSFMRASGLQTTVGLGYSYQAYRTGFYPVPYLLGTVPVAEQERQQTHLLTGVVRASQYLGKPTRPGLVLGLELGADYALRSTTELVYRPLAGGPALSAGGYRYTEKGGAVPYLAALAGVAFPLNDRQQVHLSTFYQRYLVVFSGIHMVGLRASCSFFPR